MKKKFSAIFFLLVLAGIYLFGTEVSAQGYGPGTSSLLKDNSVLPLDGNHTLGQTYSQSACGLNYVQASVMVQTRTAAQTPPFNVGGTGIPTTLSISGIPACATILKAYVWYLVSYIGASSQSSGVDITNPVPATSSYVAVDIGEDQDKCWGETGTVNYRADVTPSITGNGNYIINITGITGSGGNFPNWYDQIDGVTLMIIYKDNGATYQGSIVLWDGTKTGQMGANYTQTMTGINACGNSTFAQAFLLVSDMQENVNLTHASTLNGATANYPSIFYCFDLTNTNITAGQATSNFGTNGPGGECFDWALMGLYYQTTTCTTCVPTSLSLSVTSTPASCGASTGSASAIASGSPPLTYLWNTGATSSSISNLAAGTYSVSVTDANGCSTVQTIIITSSAGPAVTFTSNAVSCNGGNNGSAAATATGGSPPYTYAWGTNPVQTAPTATGLTAGSYSVVVSDASGCSGAYTVAVTQPSAIMATISSTPSSCGGNTGTATTSPSGGTVPYSYSWNTNPVQASSTATGLAAGTYSVVVSDALGCSAVYSVIVTQPSAITVTTNSTPSSCGGNIGTATATASGGTPGYTYNWSNGQIAQTATALAPGTYTITVTDANGCSISNAVVVAGSSGSFAVTPSQINAACFGSSNASASVTPAGGTTPYTYAWSTNPLQTTSSVSGIPAGNYTCAITDGMGCTSTATFVITQPPSLTAAASLIADVSCAGGSNASASSSGSGGTPPYSYHWTPTGQNTQTASALAAGTYSVVVTDANGCTAVQAVNITQPLAISLTQTSVQTSCGAADGSATVSASGGTAAYTYLWLTSPVQTTQTITHIAAGIYNVLVTDANGCNQSIAVNVTSANSPLAGFSNEPDTVNLLDAVIYFTDLSNNASSWFWDFGDPLNLATSTAQNPSHTYSDTGVYCITLVITDPGGICKDTAVHCIKVEAPSTFFIPNTFTPNHDGKNDIFMGYGTYISEFHMYIFDRWGNLIFESDDITKGWDGKVQGGPSAALVQEDVYVWKVTIVDVNHIESRYIGHVNMVR